MKYISAVLLSVIIIISGCAALGGRGVTVPDGVYEGIGQGHRGPVHVRVRLIRGSVAEIEILACEEDPLVGGKAIEELTDLVIEYNTADIDVISGATESSRGFLEAVENAIMGL